MPTIDLENRLKELRSLRSCVGDRPTAYQIFRSQLLLRQINDPSLPKTHESIKIVEEAKSIVDSMLHLDSNIVHGDFDIHRASIRLGLPEDWILKALTCPECVSCGGSGIGPNEKIPACPECGGMGY